MAQSIFFDVIARDKASSTFSKIGKSSDSAHGNLKKFGQTAGKLAGLVGVAGFGAGLVSFFKDANAEAREAQRAGALTTQVIKSTGGAAKVTADHVGELANSISRKVGIDDEAIQSGENLLLTFKGIRNEAGKNNKIFDEATQASVDLAAGMAAASGGQADFRSSTTLVGKALNDPIKGLTALARVGVTFSKGQTDRIKNFVAEHKTMAAQKIILKELKSEFGGAAASQATAGDKARVAWKNLEEQIGTALLPTVDRLATSVSDDVVPAVSQFVTGMQDGTGAGGEFVDVLRDAADVGKTALRVLDAIPGPVKRFGAEGLIAYAVLRKLASASSGFGASLASPIARSKQFYAELTYTETRMQRVATVSRRLGEGLRQVGGTAGMLAVVDGAKRSNHALGALEMTAGGIAAGFAIGGPVGAAVGGAVGYFGALAKEVKDTGGAAKNSLSSWRDYAGTLDDVSAATTRATRAMILERLEKTGLLRQTQALNISDRDAVQAALGNEAARKRVSAALGEAVAQGKNYQALKIAQNLGVETTAIYSSRVAQLKKNLALAATKEEAQKIQAKLDRLAKTNANPSIRIAGAGTAISQLTAIQQLLHDVTGKKGGNAQPPKTGSLLGQLSGVQGATGGIVTRPTFALIGEAGPEAVVPLNRTPGSSPLPAMSTVGGGTVTHVVELRLNGRTIRKILLDEKQNSSISLGLD